MCMYYVYIYNTHTHILEILELKSIVIEMNNSVNSSTADS